eukprot:SAG31_NODE_39789_length_285_cov_1.107527_1_plen_83_part_10
MLISNGQGILGSLCENGIRARERMDLRKAALLGRSLAMALLHRLDGACKLSAQLSLAVGLHLLLVLACRDETNQAVKLGELCL